jgi:hypothetical protein
MFALQGDAQTFVVYLLKRMEATQASKEVMTWDLFKKALTARYDRQGIRSDVLHQELTVKYEGVRRMVEYITAFRENRDRKPDR